MRKFLRKNAEKIISVSICMLIICIAGIYAGNLVNKDINDKNTGRALKRMEEGQKKINVFVDGEVMMPGEYSLPEGARVGDAIEAAGGFTEKANDKINLVFLLKEGDHITVVDKSKSANSGIDYKVNINTADKTELCQIEGIGDKMAERIIDYREKNGEFAFYLLEE